MKARRRAASGAAPFFNGVISGQPEMALSIYQGNARDLETWLAEGMADVILTYDSRARSNQTLHALPPEELVLYSNQPDTPIDADPFYIFVDHGPEFRQQHDEAYHNAGVERIHANDQAVALQGGKPGQVIFEDAQVVRHHVVWVVGANLLRQQHDEAYHNAGVERISFDSSWWALQCLLDRGGSAYLPRALADPFVARGDLHVLTDGPVFTRKINVIVNDSAARNWPWFAGLVDTLSLWK